jgi:hypothetical protein
MVTVDPPLGVLTLPKLSEIWRAITLHPPVAITALICATVAFCFLVWSLTRASDATVLALAVSTVVGGGLGAWAKLRGNGKSKG